MGYGTIIALAVVVVIGYVFKYLAALLVAKEDVSIAKAKIIADLFSFNPADVLAKFLAKK